MKCQKLIAFFLVCAAALISSSYGATIFRSRSLLGNEVSHQKEKDICQRSTPCGWAVYHRFTRDIDYFVKNKCECSENLKCMRTDDDISVTAYVYRCKENPKDNKNNSKNNDS